MCPPLFISTSAPQPSPPLDNSFVTGRLATSLMTHRIILVKPEYVSRLQAANRFPLSLKSMVLPNATGPIFQTLLPL